jgi:hypothetical protein
MKLGDSRGIKTRFWFPNEILREVDINRIGKSTYMGVVTLVSSSSDSPQAGPGTVSDWNLSFAW